MNNNDKRHRATNLFTAIHTLRIIGGALIVGSAFGATAEAITDAAEIETVVVTASRYDQSAKDVTASIRSVSADELRLIGAVHINAALARAPGTWISRGNGQEHLTAIRSPVFTGAGSCGAFYMAEDGIPLRPAGFCNVNELSEVNSEQAARIEVLRGPGTAVHGANAQHGVINVISAAPPAGTVSSLALEGGPHGYARLLASHGSGSSDGDGWLLTLNTARDGGYQKDSGFGQQKLSYRFDHDWEEVHLSSLLSYMNLNQETAGYLVGEDIYRQAGRRRENPNPEAFRDNRALRWYTRLDLALEGGAELALTPHLRYQDMRFLQHFLPGQPLEENGLHSAGLQSAWRKPFGDAIDLHAGVDLEWSEGRLEQTQAEPMSDASAFPIGKHYDYTVQSLNAAAYARFEWHPGGATRVSAGIRAERQHYDYDNRMLAGASRDDGTFCGTADEPLPCRYSRPADRDDRFAEISWNAGLLHAIGDRQTLVLNFAHGFRPPQAAELYRLQAGQLVADTDSEQIDSLEFGWRGRFGAFSGSVTAYVMEKDNVIFQDAQRRNVSGAKTRHRGLEYSLSWPLSRAWRVAADGTWALHSYESSDNLQGLGAGVDIEGNAMDTAPRAFSSARLVWEPDSRTAAELEWQHMGAYYLEPTEGFDYPGHDLLHLRLRRELNSAWSLTARITNLLDENYAERADYAFGNYRYFVGEPRGFYLEIAWVDQSGSR